MSWNYRVIRRPDGGHGFTYQIHEVFYKKDGTPDVWSADPVAALGETGEELREDIGYMLRAFSKPVLIERKSNGEINLIEIDE